MNTMTDDTVLSDLMKLGLHLNEAKAYKGLVTLGVSTAREVAQQSGVPRSKVYEVLYSLEERGLVRKVTGTDPTEFRPYDPKDAIPFLVEKIHASGRSVQKALEDISEERTGGKDELIYVVEGVDQIKMESRKIIFEAKSEVFIATMDPNLLSSVRPALAKAKTSGVEIKLFTAASLDGFQEFRHYADMKSLDHVSPKTLVKHMKDLIDDDTIDSAGWNPTQISIIVVDNTQSIGLFKSTPEGVKPWALCVKLPLIVIFQRQVITALLSEVMSLMSG